jgi:hypothetical protein
MAVAGWQKSSSRCGRCLQGSVQGQYKRANSMRRGRSITVSERTKQRLALLRSPQFGESEHQVIMTLLDLVEPFARMASIGLDMPKCGTPVSRNTNKTHQPSGHNGQSQ